MSIVHTARYTIFQRSIYFLPKVKLYDTKMIKPGKTFCLIQKTPAFTTDGERCAEEDQNYTNMSIYLPGDAGPLSEVAGRPEAVW